MTTGGGGWRASGSHGRPTQERGWTRKGTPSSLPSWRRALVGADEPSQHPQAWHSMAGLILSSLSHVRSRSPCHKAYSPLPLQSTHGGLPLYSPSQPDSRLSSLSDPLRMPAVHPPSHLQVHALSPTHQYIHTTALCPGCAVPSRMPVPSSSSTFPQLLILLASPPIPPAARNSLCIPSQK